MAARVSSARSGSPVPVACTECGRCQRADQARQSARRASTVHISRYVRLARITHHIAQWCVPSFPVLGDKPVPSRSSARWRSDGHDRHGTLLRSEKQGERAIREASARTRGEDAQGGRRSQPRCSKVITRCRRRPRPYRSVPRSHGPQSRRVQFASPAPSLTCRRNAQTRFNEGIR